MSNKIILIEILCTAILQIYNADFSFLWSVAIFLLAILYLELLFSIMNIPLYKKAETLL